MKDYKSKKKKREVIDKETKRATPAEWSRYVLAWTAIKLYNRSDTNISNILRKSSYVNDRQPQKAKFMDTSWLKVGQQSIHNRIGSILTKISLNWVHDMTDVALRCILKKEFLKYAE